MSSYYGRLNASDLSLSGQGLITETFPRALCQGVTIPAAGTIFGTMVGLTFGTTITNIVVGVTVNASSATLVKAGVYSSTGTLLASSADQKDLFNSGSTTRYVPIPLSSAYVVPADGAYHLGFLSVGGTSPTLVRGINLSSIDGVVGSGILPYWQSAGGKSDIATTSLNSTGTAFWFGIS